MFGVHCEMTTMAAISSRRRILSSTLKSRKRVNNSCLFVYLLSLVSCVSCQLWFEGEIKTIKEKKEELFDSFASRMLHSTAAAACEEDALQNEENLEDIGLDCECRRRRDGVLLLCLDECAYCNEDETVCGIQSAQAFYEHDTGERSAVGGVFQYVTGLSDNVAVENLGCVEENGSIVSCSTCNVYVNGRTCNSCELVSCPNGGVAENIDCENIETGATFDFCEVVEIDDGVFQALATNAFEECLPIDALDLGKGTSSRGKGKGKGGKRAKQAKKSKGGGRYHSSSSSSSDSSPSESSSSSHDRRPYGKGGKSAKKTKSRRGLVSWIR